MIERKYKMSPTRYGVAEQNENSKFPNIIPARVHSEQAASLLGFGSHDIPILVTAHLLEPLGNPVQNSPKYFASCHIKELAQNPEWLEDATQAIYDHWKRKTSRKSANVSKDEPAPPPDLTE